METSTRGRRKKRGSGAPVGTFCPAIPSDTFEVMRLFAAAARVTCAAPHTLEHIEALLLQVTDKLVAPEATAAQECLRLWKLFSRVARVPKETLRVEAGKALCRDLDALGQRLDLPPLSDWDELPEGVEDAGGAVLEVGGPLADGSTLDTVRVMAQGVMESQAGETHFPAVESARLVGALGGEARRQLFEQMIGQGLLSRADVNLLIRFLVKGDALGPSDTVLVEVLQRLGRHLAT